MLSGLWWAILVLSEALLVSGVPGQAFSFISLWLYGPSLCAVRGVTTARIAKQKLVEPGRGQAVHGRDRVSISMNGVTVLHTVAVSPAPY